jgi:hypothetical protein
VLLIGDGFPNNKDAESEDGFPNNKDAESEILNGYPFLEIQLVRDHAFRVLTELIFATDRSDRPKGLVEVIYE